MPLQVGEQVGGAASMSLTTVSLEVGESKIRQFTSKRAINAVLELIWNSLDANATAVTIQLIRTPSDAIEQIRVIDNGHGFSAEEAGTSFREYGETWKQGRTHGHDNQRILHGANGEGRLFSFALGDRVEWHSVSSNAEVNYSVRVSAETARPTVWEIEDLGRAMK